MTQDESTAGPDDFEQWLDERPRWMQATAARLIEAKRLPNQTELGELTNLCINEANGEDCSAYPVVLPGTMAQAALRPTISIRAIDEVQSVNALRDGATLTFDGSGLTVVYGKNGSGKTGFSRIVKHAAGARHKGDLHSNVFKDIGQETKARITYAVDGVEREPVTWNLKSGPIPYLRYVHIFDTKSAEMYVTSENEATYEPSRMRFISSLIKISDDVAALLREAKEQKVSSLHQLPPEFVETASGKWLKNLSDKTAESDVESNCTYTKELDDERIASEAAIAQKNIDSRLTEIAKDRLSLLKAGNMLNTLKTSLSDDAVSKILAARSTAQLKRMAASEDAKKVFGSAPIHGVGEQSWLDMWEQARMFSTRHAYPQQNFPFIEDHARCVLCQQSLSDDARARLAAFEEFVCKGLEKSAKIAESELASLLSGLPTVPEESDWLLQVTAFRVDEDVAKVCLESLRVRVDSAKSLKQGDAAPSIYFQPLEQALSSLTSALSAEEASLKELQKDGKRKEMVARVLELRAKQWLSQNKKSINEERVRKQEIALLERAIGITNTAPLTIKNNKLAQTELDAGYQKRFSEELDKLGNKLLPIKPTSKFIGKGRVTFGLELIGVKQQVRAHEILSEGENRVIALAAFLADITGSNQRSLHFR